MGSPYGSTCDRQYPYSSRANTCSADPKIYNLCVSFSHTPQEGDFLQDHKSLIICMPVTEIWHQDVEFRKCKCYNPKFSICKRYSLLCARLPAGVVWTRLTSIVIHHTWCSISMRYGTSDMKVPTYALMPTMPRVGGAAHSASPRSATCQHRCATIPLLYRFGHCAIFATHRTMQSAG